MSDFMSRNILSDLWAELLECHWKYFNSEESILKLEKRRKLEGCLKDFLCLVQHDRKFFLSETEEVFRKSIRDMENFSAQNAISAFEAISQYANNIFTKPWRKEFRTLKMYSGYYQHEIVSNLLDADKLFEAMGYRRLSENMFILDGPICPDQVTNVSRDAMIAYVELQIIKQIHTVLDTNGIKCSWLDIFRHREKNIGGISQAIKAFTKLAEEKRYRSREKALTNDNYGYIDVQPPLNYLTANYKFCPAQCYCHHYQQLAPTARQRLISQTNGMYCLPEHHQPTTRADNCMYSNMTHYPAQHNYHHYQHNQAGLYSETAAAHIPQISHSRSLEHYSEPSTHNHNTLPHRHSFDHQHQGCTAQHQQHHYSQHQQQHNYQYINHYESPYDCIDGNSLGDGSSSISYAAVAANIGSSTGNANCNMGSNSTYSHPYNVSGNRFPLPLNISNQISAYDSLQTANFNDSKDPTYAHIGEQYMRSSVTRQPQNCVLNSGIAQNVVHQIHGITNASLVTDSLPRQLSHQPEQLISFDDTSVSLQPTTQQQVDSLNQYQLSYEPSNNLMDKRYIQPSTAAGQHFAASKTAKNEDMHVYAKPTPKENRKSLHDPIHLRKPSCSSREKSGGTTDISYESANDDLMNLSKQNERNHLHSPTQFTKNQDGVGSYGSWNYVFQNLERSGYSKDLGNRDELLIQSLDLDSLNINNDTSASQASSIEKRKPSYLGNENKNAPQYQQQQQMSQNADCKQKGQTLNNSPFSTKNNGKIDILASSSTLSTQKQRAVIDNNEKKVKSSLKQTNATSKSNPNFNKAQPKNADNKSLPRTLNNNNDSSSTTIVEIDTTTRKKSSQTSVISSSSKKSAHGATSKAPSSSLSTQMIATGSNEWSCTFCTFLNPNTRRICEMCCRTKDNKLDASSNSTAVGTNAVAHNTTTCA